MGVSPMMSTRAPLWPVFSGKLSHVTPIAEEPTPEVPPAEVPQVDTANLPREVGGREGPSPTRFGDWELRGRCIDF